MSGECYGCGHHPMDCTCDSAGLGEDEPLLHWSWQWGQWLIGIDLTGWQQSAHLGPLSVWWWAPTTKRL